MHRRNGDHLFSRLCIGTGKSIWKYVIQHVYQQRLVFTLPSCSVTPWSLTYVYCNVSADFLHVIPKLPLSPFVLSEQRPSWHLINGLISKINCFLTLCTLMNRKIGKWWMTPHLWFLCFSRNVRIMRGNLQWYPFCSWWRILKPLVSQPWQLHWVHLGHLVALNFSERSLRQKRVCISLKTWCDLYVYVCQCVSY